MTSDRAIAAPRSGADAGIGPGCEREDRQRDQTAEDVIAGRSARLRLKERVVDDVQGDRPDRRREPG